MSKWREKSINSVACWECRVRGVLLTETAPLKVKCFLSQTQIGLGLHNSAPREGKGSHLRALFLSALPHPWLCCKAPSSQSFPESSGSLIAISLPSGQTSTHAPSTSDKKISHIF